MSNEYAAEIQFLAAEREELRRLLRARQLDEVTAKKLFRDIDLQELRYL